MENKIPSVIILSGGKSLRMQLPKAFLKKDDKTLVEHLVNVYIEFGIVEPIVILNKTLFTGEWMNIITKLYQKAKIGFNQYTVLGRTYSIQMGLDRLEYAEDCFIQNIDNPDISVELLDKMWKKLEPNTYVVACKNGFNGHPILISKEILADLKELKGNNWILKDMLKNYKRIQVEAEKNNVLLNLNTMEDWLMFLRKVN
ncbi:MAG: NTP transferase domain-containing protein [Bacteroidota bacterium]